MIRLFIIEDSAAVRYRLLGLFHSAADFEVVGIAGTVAEASALLPDARPDLVSLDVFLPDASAADAVRLILSIARVPIVLLSEARENADEVLAALAMGASGFLSRPKAVDKQSTAALLDAMRAVCRAPLALPREARVAAGTKEPASAVLTLASSTGGPNALRELLSVLPAEFPLPILVAQHMAEGFEDGVARWLTQASRLQCTVMRELRRPLFGGEVILGRSGWDMRVVSREEVLLERAPPRGYHPSGDLLFSSASRFFGGAVISVVLSGIGSDGTVGAADVARAGGTVLVQDEATSVVFGMPGSVIQSGFATLVGTPLELGRAILQTVMASTTSRPAVRGRHLGEG